MRIDSNFRATDNYINTKKLVTNNISISDEQFDEFYVNYQNEPLNKPQIKDFFEKQGINPARNLVLDIKPEEMLRANLFNTPFSVVNGEGFNEANNSVSLIPGSTIDLGTGYYLEITETSVVAKSKDNSFYNEEELKKANKLAGSLNTFIRYANDQSGSIYFDADAQKNVLGILEKMGIDTSKEFTVNGSVFQNQKGKVTKDGAIEGYAYLPSSMLKQNLEQMLAKYTSNFMYVQNNK